MNVADDRMVYVAFNSIFQGQDSQIRKSPAIKRLVAKYQEQPQIAQLLEEYSAPVIYEKLQRLLVGQVFESTVKAKTQFPELFEVSRAQSAERAISEAEAAADHAKAVEEAIASADRYGKTHDSKTYDSDYDSGETGTDSEVEEPLRREPDQGLSYMGTGVPSLFPLEFNFTTGYRILIQTQEVLELACFRFAQKAMPEILEKRQWHCTESAELNLWATEFLKRLGKFKKSGPKALSPSRPLKELFPSIAQIRHHAVHRIPVTAKELEQFMADGETLAQLFEDESTIKVMSRARGEVQKAAAEMENRKNMLEARLTQVLQEVADKRAELDRVEAEAIADMQRKDKEYQLFAGTCLQETVWQDDSVTGDSLVVPARRSAANGIDNDGLEDQVEDAMEEGSKPLALAGTFTGESDGDSVPEEVEEARNECPRPADAEGDGGETEKRELSPTSSTDMQG